MKIIRHYIHDPEVAGDILHDGFIVAFTQIAKLRDYDKLEYWLGTIMKNLSIQYLNQVELTTLLNDDIDVPEIPEIHTLISYEELEAIINLLPDGYRKVFKLAVLDNMSHAEIGKLLGIAPHSSSSQLFRAKEMLRRIIREHGIELSGAIGMIVLLLAIVPRFLNSNFQISAPDIASESSYTIYIPKAPSTDEAPAVPDIPNDITSPGQMLAQAIEPTPTESVTADINITETIEAQTTVPDTTADTVPTESEVSESAATEKEPTRHIIPKHTTHNSGFNLAVNTSFGVGNTGAAAEYPGNLDYAGNLTGGPPTPSISTDTDKDKGFSNVKHQPTISVGVTANYMLTRTLGIESGLTYSYLRSEASKSNNLYRFRYHYVGIPVKLNLSIYSTPGLRIYGSAGAGIDIPVAASKDDSFEKNSISAPVQWSLNGGVGIQLNLTRRVSLYAEPSVRYNFRNNDSEVINKWADERFQFTLPIGLRLNF